MIEYIKNIIPRIQRYSKDLSKIENFIDKNWIFIDENGNNHEYLFLRDKRLIMTLGSTTKEGSWELLPTGQLLIARGTNDLVKLENMFVEHALLVLKRSATDDTPFVLINQQLIPDLDAVKYLEKFEYKKFIESIPISEQKYKLFQNGEVFAPDAYVGKKIKTFDDIILNGTYKTTDNNNKYLLLENNIVKNIFFRVEYLYDNKILSIDQSSIKDPEKNDLIVKDNNIQLPLNKPFTIKNINLVSFVITINSSYKIIKSQNQDVLLFNKIRIIILIVILIGILIQLLNNS